MALVTAPITGVFDSNTGALVGIDGAGPGGPTQISANLGTYPTSAALPTLTAAQAGTTALVGTAAPYVQYLWNGAAWGPQGSGSGTPIQLSANLVINAANVATYNGATVEDLGSHNITLSVGVTAASPGFWMIVQPAASGTTSILGDGTSKINDATATVFSCTYGNKTLYGVEARASVSDSFLVS